MGNKRLESFSGGIAVSCEEYEIYLPHDLVFSSGSRKMARRLAGDLLRGSFFVVPVAVAFNDVVGSASTVSGRSMQPTLNPHATG